MDDPLIAVCIPTCKRIELLRQCLVSVGGLRRPDGCRIEIIVVDNDAGGSAGNLVREIKASLPFPVHYFIHPARGLSEVRNRLLEEALGIGAGYIAFIDDDEQPDTDWLSHHLRSMEKFAADVCTGPVRPRGAGLEVRGKKPMETGTRPRHVSTNNVVFRSALVSSQGLHFDPFYNFIGGEDFDFFERSGKNGNIHVWVEEAPVWETVAAGRDSFRYLFYRHFTGGINNVLRYQRNYGRPRAWGRFVPKAAGKIVSALFWFLAAVVRLNSVLLADAVKKFASGLGYQAGLLNIVVERYRNIDPPVIPGEKH